MDDTRNADLVLAGQRLKNPFHRDFFRHDFPKKTFAVTKAAISTRLASLLSSSALYGITEGKSGLSLILVQQYAGQGIEPGLFKNLMTNTPLKFTGVGTAGTYESVAQSQLCDRESFYGLKRRRFHVSQRGHLPYIAAASPLLAGQEERMGHEDWAAFAAAQLTRWYRPPETEAADPGLTPVSGADPEEYVSRPAGPALPAPPPPALGPPAQVPAAGGGLLAGICRGLGFRTPSAPAAGARPPPAVPPVPAPALPPAAEPSRLAAEGFEAEEEIAPGQFYARKKPKFAPP